MLPAEALEEGRALAVHEVEADEADGFTPTGWLTLRDSIAAGEFAAVRLTLAGRSLRVQPLLDRPGHQAFPPWVGPSRRLAFALEPGTWGRVRANSRHVGCSCTGDWWYEKLVVNVAWRPGPAAELFAAGAPARRVDQLVSLR